jgi:hypothetical protein
VLQKGHVLFFFHVLRKNKQSSLISPSDELVEAYFLFVGKVPDTQEKITLFLSFCVNSFIFFAYI